MDQHVSYRLSLMHLPQPCDHINFDVDLLGDCDVVVAELCRRAGWIFEHEMIPADQLVDVVPDEEMSFRHQVRVRDGGGDGGGGEGVGKEAEKKEKATELKMPD